MKRCISCLILIVISLASYAKTSVFEYTLSNGLKVLVKEDHRSPVAIAQVWYKVGSSYESTGITGISHLLEHMMFRGTKKHAHGVLDKIIMENGGIHNAFTGDDFTCYFEILPSDKLDIIFDLEADRMRNLALNDEGFTEEKQIVIEERKMSREDLPEEKLYERFLAAAYASNPYRTPVIGWMRDIEHLNLTDLKNWYKNWYSPNNAILVVVGDVDPQKVLQMAKQYFGGISSGKLPEVKLPEEIMPLGKRNLVVKVPAKVPSIIMGYNVPSLKTALPKWHAYALNIISALLSKGSSSRLERNLIRQAQLASAASSYYNLNARLDTLFILSADPAAKRTVKEVEAAFLKEIKKLQSILISKEELQKIKNLIISSQVYSKDSIIAQAQEIGILEAVGSSWRNIDEYIENIKAVTPKQIQDVAKLYFTADRLTVAELYPQSFIKKKK
jgi:zinc protease